MQVPKHSQGTLRAKHEEQVDSQPKTLPAEPQPATARGQDTRGLCLIASILTGYSSHVDDWRRSSRRAEEQTERDFKYTLDKYGGEKCLRERRRSE